MKDSRIVGDGTRLNKYIAQAGVASRRRADELIAYGKVRINGKVVRELGTMVAPGDKVDVSGTPISAMEQTEYLVVHKPAGVMTTMRDPQGRRTVADLIPKRMPRVVPVGRLDYDTAGVLLMTNDGDLANRLAAPALRCGEDLSRHDWRTALPRTMSNACTTASPWRTASMQRVRRCASSRFARDRRSSTSRSTKAAIARFGACSRRSVIRCRRSFGCVSGRLRSAISRSATRARSRRRNFPHFGALLPRMGSIALRS